MKTNRFLCIILATVLAFTLIPLSASAAYYSISDIGLGDLQYMGSYGNTKLSNVSYGSLVRVAVGDDLLECYQPTSYIQDSSVYRIIYEKYGLYTHILDSNKSISIGSWSVDFTAPTSSKTSCTFTVSLNGSSVKTWSMSSSAVGAVTFRYGYTLLNIGGVPYLWFQYRPIDGFSSVNYQSNTNYCVNYVQFDSVPAGNFVNGSDSFLLNLSAGGANVNTEVDIQGGTQTPATVFFDSWTTCPNCGSHNVSYKASFLHTGAMVVTGQIGYVFSCRDCGASWRGIVSNSEENELFKQYMQDVEYTENLVEDNTLPPFVTTGGTVDLPSDVGGVADYIQQVFAALSSFTSAFNDFFGAVFAVLPPPVLGVILLGVGLVVIIGIIKAVRG